MEKLSKDEIVLIAQDILSKSDLIAKHGTSMANAQSILKTGFYFDKTSMAIQTSKNIIALCSYGWKENIAGDTTNVVISIPKSFIKKLNDYSDEEYAKWIEMVCKNNYSENAIISLTSVVEYSDLDNTITKKGKFFVPRLPNYCKRHLPREFIRGFFAFSDNKTYRDFLDNPSEALNHLSYVENPHYFENISLEEQEIFVDNFRNAKRKLR